MAAKDELGRRGEDEAVRYLERRGLVVLSRNWRCRDGELDVVAVDTDRLVVCEVKTRSGTRFGEPAEAVTPRKAARIRRVTQAWLAAHHAGGRAHLEIAHGSTVGAASAAPQKSLTGSWGRC